jgi:hypothetical protein
MVLLPYLSGLPEIKKTELAARLTVCGKLRVARILVAALCGAKVYDIAADLERNRPVFRDVHPADRIAY